jgi:hypothetical protein
MFQLGHGLRNLSIVKVALNVHILSLLQQEPLQSLQLVLDPLIDSVLAGFIFFCYTIILDCIFDRILNSLSNFGLCPDRLNDAVSPVNVCLASLKSIKCWLSLFRRNKLLHYHINFAPLC